MENQDKLTLDEMYLLFHEKCPVIHPNLRVIGKFAKKMGYVKMRQMIDGKLEHFYVKENIYTQIKKYL